MDNQREFTRVTPHFTARILSDGEILASVATLDISLNGALLECGTELPAGKQIQLVIELDDNPALQITAGGTITRKEAGRIAVEFNDIDIDSYQHLEKLVLYNSLAPDEIKNELESHLGIKPKN